MPADSFQALHRLSFGHRNRRSYVVVVYSPTSAECRAAEAEIERLAAGVKHDRSVAVIGLNADSPSNKAIVQQLLQVKRLPAVLLYPEGAPGYLRHKGVAAQGALSSSSSGSSGDGALSSSLTAERLLHSVNACRARILPDKPPTQLLLPAAAVASIDAGAPSPAPAPKLPLQAAPAGGGGSAAAGAGAEAVAATAAAAPAPAAKTAAKRSVSVAAPARPPAPPTSAYGSYWTPQKSSFWGFALVFSVLLFAWDRWGLAAFDAWLVARRMHQRQAGKKFDAATNLEDIATLMILQGDGGKRQGPSGAPPAAPAGAGAGGEAAPAASPPPPPSGAASENGNGARQG